MDQTGDMQHATHEDIVKKAKAKYDLLVNSSILVVKSPDQEKIIALKAQLKDLKLCTPHQQAQARSEARPKRKSTNYTSRKS